MIMEYASQKYWNRQALSKHGLTARFRQTNSEKFNNDFKKQGRLA
jgi:hypothetical protein